METTELNKKMYWGISSYRTYEEWKHRYSDVHEKPELRSYRTYEEWKPVMPATATPAVVSSYRTYEEWKRSSKWIKIEEQGRFLPYL